MASLCNDLKRTKLLFSFLQSSVFLCVPLWLMQLLLRLKLHL